MKKKVGILLKSVLLLCGCMLFFTLSSCENEVNPINEENMVFKFEDGVVYVYTLYDESSSRPSSFRLIEYKNAYVNQYNTYFTVVVKTSATAREEYQFSNSAFGYRTSATVNNYEN